MHETLQKYIPEKSIELVIYLIKEHKIRLKIVNQRQTKHGDFRAMPNGETQITVNNTLNKYQFLLTLIHEIAHHVTYKKFGRVQPHGKEWKTAFQHLMLPFLNPEIYHPKILPHLANYLKNPKASTDTDVNLALALKNGVAEEGKNFIFEIPNGHIFSFKNILYRRGNKRRTRYECINLTNKRVYLFNQNAEVIPVKMNNKELSSLNLENEKTIETGKNLVSEVPLGGIFNFKDNLYKRGNKRRTRYECLNLTDNQTYLFNQNTPIILVKKH